MAQSTNIANGPAGDARDHLDINFSTIDYADRDKTANKQTFEIKEFNRTDGKLILHSGLGTTALAAIAGGAIYIFNKKKKHQRCSKSI